MNAIALIAHAPKSASTSSSDCGSGTPSGTIRSRSSGSGRAGFRRRPASSSAPEITRSFALALTLQPLADHDADRNEHRRPDQPRDKPLRNRPEVADRPAAAIVRVLRVFDVPD